MESHHDFGFCTAYLKAGEHIVWKESLQQGHFFKKEDLYIIPIALLAPLTAFLYFFFEELFWDFQILYFGENDAFLLVPLSLALRFFVVLFLQK